jgi:hypothetical protein
MVGLERVAPAASGATALAAITIAPEGSSTNKFLISAAYCSLVVMVTVYHK